MTIERLNRNQIEYVYKHYMVKDFPRNERKSLGIILKSVNQGVYDCLGIFEADELAGYAFFMVSGEDYLFDYFAITESRRNSGIGAEFLSKLPSVYPNAHTLIGEVEDYTCASDSEACILQKRRLNFYLRNGLVDTGIRTTTFGVPFMILELPINGTHGRDNLTKLYLHHYHSFLTWRTRLFVRVHS